MESCKPTDHDRTSWYHTDNLNPMSHSSTEIDNEIWIRLYKSAREVNRLAPWKWIKSGEFFGIQNSQTGEIRFGSAVSDSKGHTGLLFLRGQQGFEFVMRFMSGKPTFDPINAENDHDMLSIFYHFKSELRAEQRQRLRQVKFVPAGENRRAFPSFTSHSPQQTTVEISLQEAETLVHDLPRFLAMANLTRDTAYDEDRSVYEFPFYPVNHPLSESLTLDQIDWRTFDNTEPQPEQVTLPENQIETAKAQDQFPGSSWELGFLTTPFGEINASGHPSKIIICMVADHLESQVLFQKDATDDKSPESNTVSCLIDAIINLKMRPKSLIVAQAKLHATLIPIAEALEIRITESATLPTLQRLKQLMDQGP